MEFGMFYAMLGSAAAIFLGGYGSSIGIGLAGAAANGVLSEKPEKFGSMLLFVALPGTQGIYGFLVAFLIILKLQLLTGKPISVSNLQGLEMLIAALPVGITGISTGIYQGRICAAGIAIAAKKPEASMKGLVYAAMVETYAVLGLVISYFLLNGIVI
ncbi:MAG: V-type ATP synthase subunit K [Elusimicrobiota bacterium]|nr:V-type ATP synthase subunit K [Elusimicrobiota bacterium]